MILQQLTIHNIASIEDATIEFEAQPLCDSEVFLITGKTGAGKSTLLDSICLALYANTPRLENTLMQGDTPDGDKTVKIYDPRQLMRRNTGEAWVRLTFVGSNGVPYEARWAVARARKKPGGNIQGKDWTLTNRDTGNVLTKDKEIEAEIHRAIGLDFHQFCRTTMLAQGEFTRFLNSRDDEKAEILEKITGVSIYSKIGAKVFEMTGNKEDAWKKARSLVDNVKVLTDEEVEARRNEMLALETEYRCLKAEKEEQDKRYRWLLTANEQAEAVRDATEAHRQAVQRIGSDDFRQKEQLVKEWNETIEARHRWQEQQRAAAEQRRLDDELRELAGSFRRVRAGEQGLAFNRRFLESERIRLDKWLEEEQEKAGVYGQAQTLDVHLGTVIDRRRQIEEEKRRMAAENERLAGILKQQEIAAAAWATAGKAFAEQETLVGRQEQELAELDLPRLRRQKEGQLKSLNDVATATLRLSALEAEQQRAERTRKALEESVAAIGRMKQEWEARQPSVREAAVRRDTCREWLDKQRESVNRWAKDLRRKLQVGDVCPVCRQPIVAALPHEADLDGLCAAAEEAFGRAEQAYNHLVEQQNRLEADIRSQTGQWQQARKAFEEDRTLETCRQNAAAACGVCGIDTLEGAAAALDRRKAALQAEEQECTRSVAAAEQKEKEVKASRRELEKLRKASEQAKAEVDGVERQRTDCCNKIATARSLLENRQKELEQAGEQIRRLVVPVRWQHDWQTQTEAFRAELRRGAEQYEANVRQKQAKEQQWERICITCDQVASTVCALLQLMPDWESVTAEQPDTTKDLWNVANVLRTQVQSVKDRWAEAVRNEATAKQSLDRFLAACPAIGIERVKALSAYTPTAVSALGEELRRERDNALSKQTLLEQALRKQAEHAAQKPDWTEGDTVEVLSVRVAAIEKQMTEVGERKGAVGLLLRQDAESKARLSRLIAEAEERKADYERWSRINQLIGDATGNKFRKIAQSYVLASLIHSANGYLSTLTERYTLTVMPGTFVISLEDAYQGFVSRAASTLSGGESFLVSLSLALALSDIGSRLAVDTLFIDEGFGTLSGEPLQNAIDTLRSLHTKAGRHVGIISHVEELRERIPVQIRVEQEGNSSSSRVRVVG